MAALLLSKQSFEVDDYQLELTIVRKIRPNAPASFNNGAVTRFDDEELDIDSLKRRLSPLPFTKRVITFEEPTRDPEYYFDMAVLAAEDTLFQAPLVHLQGIEYQGDSDTAVEPEQGHVVCVSDLSAFFDLMDWKLSPKSNLSEVPLGFGIEEWISVLKVSRAWKLGTFSRLAEAALPSFKLTTLQKLEYGRALPFEDFLLAAYEDIISRRHTIEVDEANMLGMKSLIKLMTFREELRTQYRPRILEEPHELRTKSRVALKAILKEDIVDSWQNGSDLIGMTLLAEQENVLEWLIDVYGYFVQRTSTLSREEATMLGFDTSISIYQAREAFSQAQNSREERLSNSSDTDSDKSVLLEGVIKSSFEGHIQQTAQRAGVISRLTLAEQYGVTKWLHTAYLELTERQDPINMFEARVIGMGHLVNLCRARDRYLKNLRWGLRKFSKEQRSTMIRVKVRELVQTE